MDPEGLLGPVMSAVRSADAGAIDELVGDIISSRKVFVYGSGRSGLVGQMFAVRLVQLGIDVHFVGEMTTPIIGRDDLTVLISYTGRTSSVVQTASIARRLGSKVVCVTGTADCPLVGTSDLPLVMDVPEGEDVRRTAPLGTVFEDAALVLFDCIVADIMSREGVSEDDMRSRHAIWVRSLLHQRHGEAHVLPVHHVYRELAGLRVDHHENPAAAGLPDVGGHLVGGPGPLGGEEHPHLGEADACDHAVLAVGIALLPAGQAPVGRGPVGRVKYCGHGVLIEQDVGRDAHPVCRLDTLRASQSQHLFVPIAGRRGPAAPPPGPPPRCSCRPGCPGSAGSTLP